jgi:hypothetical protein
MKKISKALSVSLIGLTTALSLACGGGGGGGGGGTVSTANESEAAVLPVTKAAMEPKHVANNAGITIISGANNMLEVRTSPAARNALSLPVGVEITFDFYSESAPNPFAEMLKGESQLNDESGIFYHYHNFDNGTTGTVQMQSIADAVSAAFKYETQGLSVLGVRLSYVHQELVNGETKLQAGLGQHYGYLIFEPGNPIPNIHSVTPAMPGLQQDEAVHVFQNSSPRINYGTGFIIIDNSVDSSKRIIGQVDNPAEYKPGAGAKQITQPSSIFKVAPVAMFGNSVVMPSFEQKIAHSSNAEVAPEATEVVAE